MSFDQFNTTVNSVAKLVENSEKLAVPVLSAKLKKASAQFPEDATISSLTNIFSRMNTKMFITRGEFKDLYNKAYSKNTKFPEIFQSELGIIPTEIKKSASAHSQTSRDIVKESIDKLIDPVLASGLDMAFGNKSTSFSIVLGEKARKACITALQNINLPNHMLKNVVAETGTDSLVVCRANFETPKGQVHVLVPVEISEAKALIPSVFVGNSGPVDFTNENVATYIRANAGKKLNITAEKIIQLVALASKESMSDSELALSKLNASKETLGGFGNTIIAQAMEMPVKDVALPEFKDTEFTSFADQFGSSVGIASFKFGADKINLGRSVISRQLENFGFDKPQISVADCTGDRVVYAVGLNGGRVGFKVPVKISKEKVSNPDIIVVNGSVRSFSRESITQLFTEESKDFKSVAVASPLYNLKASELLDKVREAMVEENYPAAEDALNVLSQTENDKTYHMALSVYTNGLGGKQVKVASEQTKCSRAVQTKHSKHLFCSHTNLPVHKVYQDANGDCQPLYRKNSELETSQGAYFMTAKVLLG